MVRGTRAVGKGRTGIIRGYILLTEANTEFSEGTGLL